MRQIAKKNSSELFTDFLIKNSIKRYTRYTSSRAVFAERVNRSIRDLFKRQVFEKSYVNWVAILPTVTKQYKKRTISSTKLTPEEPALKKIQRCNT